MERATPANAPTLAARSRRPATAWAVFLFFLLGAAWFKAAENQQDAQLRAEWQERMARLNADGDKEFGRLKKLLRSPRDNPLTRSDLEAELNEGRPFDLQPNEGRQEVKWTHPKYGIPVRLSFKNDVLQGWGMSRGSPLMFAENAQPQPYRFDSHAEVIRRSLRSLSAALWVMSMLVAVASRRYAWPAAQIVLASALVYGAATVVSPAYQLTVPGIFSNDPMFFTVIMWLLALVALAKTWPAKSRRYRFQVRDLLLGTGGVALLLAIGPVGFLALGVFSISIPLLLGMIALRGS